MSLSGHAMPAFLLSLRWPATLCDRNLTGFDTGQVDRSKEVDGKSGKFTPCRNIKRGVLIALMRILINPCIKCGACCALYRVSFYWTEADPEQGGTVPPEMTEPLPPFLSCMRGTNQPHPRCAALRGRIGDQVSCSIYHLRSSTCREFGFQSKNGHLTITVEDLARCNHAREVWGLPPLQMDKIAIRHARRGSHIHRRQAPLH